MSAAARALSAPKSKTYLLGYVAGIVYLDGIEWLLTKSGHWESLKPDATKDQRSYAWPTVEEAMTVAKAKHSERFPAFVRAYTYSTPNPKNAEGLKEWKEETPRQMVTDLPNPKANP